MKKIINQNKKIILIYFLNIIILLLYSFYKNGIILYNKNLITFMESFKPFILFLISIFITYIIDYIFYKYIKKNKNYKLLLEQDYNPIYFSILTLTLPIGINIFMFIILLIILNIVNNLIKQKKVNSISVYKIFIIIIMILLNKYNYFNIYEMNIETSLTTLDMFLGRSLGGIGTTNTLLLIITFFIFNLIPCYKKEIPIAAIISFLLMALLSVLFQSSFILNMKELINGEFIFGILYVATIPEYSPISEKDKIIYGFLIGIFGFIFNKVINPYEGVFVAIIVVNLIYSCQNELMKLYYLRQKRDVK